MKSKKIKLDEILIYLFHPDDKISELKRNFGRDNVSWLNDFNINELPDNELVSEHENFLPNGIIEDISYGNYYILSIDEIKKLKSELNKFNI